MESSVNDTATIPSCSAVGNSKIYRIDKQPHHVKASICATRAKYRQGRRDTAVKVYTISQESYYMLVQNVPSIDISEELQKLCSTFGKVELFVRIPNYPREDFTEVYLMKYQRLQESRVAKKQLDERSFFGGSLHVCFAPECESTQETKAKMIERKRIVNSRLKILNNPGSIEFCVNNQQHPLKRNTQTPVTSRTVVNITNNFFGKTSISSLESEKPVGTMANSDKCDNSVQLVKNQAPETYIWAGKEYNVDSDAATNHLNALKKREIDLNKSGSSFVPRQVRNTQVLGYSNTSYQASRKRIADKLDSVNINNIEVKLRKKNI